MGVASGPGIFSWGGWQLGWQLAVQTTVAMSHNKQLSDTVREGV